MIGLRDPKIGHQLVIDGQAQNGTCRTLGADLAACLFRRRMVLASSRPVQSIPTACMLPVYWSVALPVGRVGQDGPTRPPTTRRIPESCGRSRSASKHDALHCKKISLRYVISRYRLDTRLASQPVKGCQEIGPDVIPSLLSFLHFLHVPRQHPETDSLAKVKTTWNSRQPKNVVLEIKAARGKKKTRDVITGLPCS